MAINQTQEYIIKILGSLSVEKEATLGILLMLETEEQQLQMLEYLANHENKKLTQEEVLKKAVKIREI